MFIFTMTGKTLKKAIIVACAVLLVCTTAVGGVLLFGQDSTEVMASQNSEYVTNIEDVVNELQQFGIICDVSTGEVSTVVVPKKFDEHFEEFNELIKRSGGDLDGVKDKAVERWRVLTVNRTAGEEPVWAVMLIRNNKSVGCYLMAEPSGQVFAIDDAENLTAVQPTGLVTEQPIDAAPTDAVPADTVPIDAVPTDAVPTDAVPTDAVPVLEQGEIPPSALPVIQLIE